MATKRRYDTDTEAVARVQDALQDLPETWLACRDMRHAWAVENDYHVVTAAEAPPKARGVAHVIARLLVCMRCETSRKETYHQTRYGLEKVAQTYGYPENYQIKGVPRGVKPQTLVQAEHFRRVMERVADGARNGKGKR